MNIPVAAFFGLVSLFTLRRIGRRFSVAEEPMPVVVSVATGALLMGGLTAGFRRLWEGAFEVMRLGNDHLSYRGLRLQWNQRWLEFAAVAACAFLVAALAHCLATIRPPRTRSNAGTGTAP